MRELTSILYANPEWGEADGGELQLWPRSETADPHAHGLSDEGQGAVRADLQRSWAGRRRPTDDEEEASVLVRPEGGRLVVFFSNLLHEVCPAARPRRAVTVWSYRPVEERQACAWQ